MPIKSAFFTGPSTRDDVRRAGPIFIPAKSRGLQKLCEGREKIAGRGSNQGQLDIRTSEHLSYLKASRTASDGVEEQCTSAEMQQRRGRMAGSTDG